jgi:hypothetical protein
VQQRGPLAGQVVIGRDERRPDGLGQAPVDGRGLLEDGHDEIDHREHLGLDGAVHPGAQLVERDRVPDRSTEAVHQGVERGDEARLDERAEAGVGARHDRQFQTVAQPPVGRSGRHRHGEAHQAPGTGPHLVELLVGPVERPERDRVPLVDQGRIGDDLLPAPGHDEPGRDGAEVPLASARPLDVAGRLGDGGAQLRREEAAQGVEVGAFGDAVPGVVRAEEGDGEVGGHLVEVPLPRFDPHTSDPTELAGERVEQRSRTGVDPLEHSLRGLGDRHEVPAQRLGQRPDEGLDS